MCESIAFCRGHEIFRTSKSYETKSSSDISMSYLVLLNHYQANMHNEVIFIVFGRKLGNKPRKPMTDNEVFNYCKIRHKVYLNC